MSKNQVYYAQASCSGHLGHTQPYQVIALYWTRLQRTLRKRYKREGPYILGGCCSSTSLTKNMIPMQAARTEERASTESRSEIRTCTYFYQLLAHPVKGNTNNLLESVDLFEMKHSLLDDNHPLMNEISESY